MKVLVTDELEEAALAKLKAAVPADYEKLGPEDLMKRIGGYDALIVRSRTKVTREVIERGTALKVIGRAGVGVDNIDVAAATAKGILVVNAADASTTAVAELTLGLMLALARRLPQADAHVRDGKWERKGFGGVELTGKVLGLVGSGRIGGEVARLARAFGMKVIAYDPYLTKEQAAAKGIELTDLNAVLLTSDFVSIHAALTPETKRMIGAKQMALMKKNVCIVNAARGGIIDELALAEALKSGALAGAALDVYEDEPPSGSPLLALPNVVLTPHLGAMTAEAQRKAGDIIVAQVLKALHGERPEWLVNAEVWGKHRKG